MKQKCGYIAIVGRANVGKSTLLNCLLGKKISIISRKPQTTRYKILGVKTSSHGQSIYLDTPGFQQKNRHNIINRYMNRLSIGLIQDVDVIVFMIDRNYWNQEDELVFSKIQSVKIPYIVAINKIDCLLNKQSIMFPYIRELQKRVNYKGEIVPISAINGMNVNKIEEIACSMLPYRQYIFPSETITTCSSHFISSEFVREQLMIQLGDEVPYELHVKVVRFSYHTGILYIEALIYVQRVGQKMILLGRKGLRLKSIGCHARREIECFFNCKIMLTLWVKVSKKSFKDHLYSDIH